MESGFFGPHESYHVEATLGIGVEFWYCYENIVWDVIIELERAWIFRASSLVGF